MSQLARSLRTLFVLALSVLTHGPSPRNAGIPSTENVAAHNGPRRP